MTAINLDAQIVSTRYDAATRTCFYIYEHHDGKRYTVVVPLDHLEKHGTTPIARLRRREHLTNCILSRLQGAPDK